MRRKSTQVCERRRVCSFEEGPQQRVWKQAVGGLACRSHSHCNRNRRPMGLRKELPIFGKNARLLAISCWNNDRQTFNMYKFRNTPFNALSHSTCKDIRDTESNPFFQTNC